MKVWIVNRGSEWSGCEFFEAEAVFSSREEAEEYLATTNQDSYKLKDLIKEFEVNADP